MIATEFEYLAPGSLEEAVSLLRQHGDDAKLLAGGHSLIPIMKLRLARPRYLIDIGRVFGLDYIKEEGGALAVGALTTHHALETSQLLRSKQPLVPETAAVIADVQVRNRGTIGGSLAHADPAADLPATVLALEAEIVATGPGGRRAIKAADFFVGLFATALAPDEIVTEIRFPLAPSRTGSSYQKVPNKASHYAIVGVATVVTLDGDGKCQSARVGVTGTSGTAYRATEAEVALAGRAPDPTAIANASELATSGVDALSDIHASAEFRLHLTKVHARRALELAVSRARAA